MIRNVVLLYMAQALFAGIAEVVSLAPRNSECFARLMNFLPWGTIEPDGVIQAGDAYQVIGEPLIAVSRVPQDLSDAATSAPTASKVVLVDGARGIVSDLQAFDDIVDRQRVVILASPDETEEIRTFRDREWPVWHLSPAEITIGEENARGRSRSSLVGRTVRVADIRERSNVVVINCQSDALQAVAAALEGVAANSDGAEEKSETEDILARLYGILLEFSDCCFEVGEEAKSDLRMAKQNFERDQPWMTPDVIEEFKSAIDRLEGVAHDGPSLEGKADPLINALVGSEAFGAVCRLGVGASRVAASTESDEEIRCPCPAIGMLLVASLSIKWMVVEMGLFGVLGFGLLNKRTRRYMDLSEAVS